MGVFLDDAIPMRKPRAVPRMANAAMQLDPVLGNSPRSDLAGGSAVFYDSMVKAEKVG